jgi:hypothetical protein
VGDVGRDIEAVSFTDDLFFTVDGKLEDAAYHIGALRVKMCMCIANCTLFKCHFHHHHFFVISQDLSAYPFTGGLPFYLFMH